MRGTITSNRGDSRYGVSYKYAQTLLQSEIDRLDEDYTAIEQRLIDAQVALSEVQEAYLARVALIDAKITAYQDCVDNFSRAACLIAEEAKCDDAYFECEAECSDAHPAGDPEYWACVAECESKQDRCLADIESKCQQAQIDHNADCADKWSGEINAAQAQAAQAQAEVQARLYEVNTLEAQKLSLAKRLTELRQVKAVDEQATVFTAQYTEDLAPGTEVEVAITPAGRTVITDSDASWSDVSAGLEQCIHDARSLPAANTFVNAALAAGAETWAPSWRTGTVQTVNADTLTVEVHPGTLYGTLGTSVSEKDINCTPPQVYFDGGFPGELGQAIENAHAALIEAQQDKLEAYAELQACLAEYDGDWFTDCYNVAAVACQNNCGELYLACIDGSTDPETCETERQACLSACLLDAAADCNAQQQTLQQACRDTHQPAVDAAESAVAGAQTLYSTLLAHLYSPADPLVLDLPVAHCSVDSYEVGDEVLIDFPERDVQLGAMAVWSSARVVGWASETRECLGVPLWVFYNASAGVPVTADSYGDPAMHGDVVAGFRPDLLPYVYQESDSSVLQILRAGNETIPVNIPALHNVIPDDPTTEPVRVNRFWRWFPDHSQDLTRTDETTEDMLPSTSFNASYFSAPRLLSFHCSLSIVLPSSVEFVSPGTVLAKTDEINGSTVLITLHGHNAFYSEDLSEFVASPSPGLELDAYSSEHSYTDVYSPAESFPGWDIPVQSSVFVGADNVYDLLNSSAPHVISLDEGRAIYKKKLAVSEAPIEANGVIPGWVSPLVSSNLNVEVWDDGTIAVDSVYHLTATMFELVYELETLSADDPPGFVP